MKKSVKIAISLLFAAAAVTGVSLGVHYGCGDTEFKQKTYDVDTGSNPLRVAVISDLQLPNDKDTATHQYESFEKTLTSLKNKGMDVLVIAGDFTDVGSRKAWDSYKKIYDKVMADSKEPIKLFILGNHDYWLPMFAECGEIPTPAKMQKRFTKYTGEPVNSHQVINGFHFICWSSMDGSYDKSYRNYETVRAELDKAVADNPENPIFVITHLNPSETVYGSDGWGNDDINKLLKDYPQVISLSGHSHFSIIDERSVWQGDYTALTTQSLDYIELEEGKYNGSVPKDAYGNRIAEDMPACLYMNIENGKVTVERLEANSGKALKEPWVFEAPFDKPAKYTDSRKMQNQAPALDENIGAKLVDIADVDGVQRTALSFKAGSDDDFVHSYKISFLDENHNALEFYETDYSGNIVIYKNGEKVSQDSEDYEAAGQNAISELLYFSDFVCGLENMAPYALLRMPPNMPENTKYVAVTAIDSWGAESNTVISELVK